MSKIPISVTIVALLLTGTSWAQESEAGTDTAAPWTAEQAERELRQARLDELMATMAEEMQAIRNAGNRDEREALMTTHRETTREAMGLMRDMGGTHLREVMAEHMGPAMGSTAEPDRARHQHKRMPSSRPRDEMSDAQRLTDLENRVDMMQVMIESMLEAETTR